MANSLKGLLTLTVAAMAMAACDGANKEATSATNAPGEAQAAHPTDPIASAMAAAPDAVGKGATIVTMDGSGKMEVLRKGTNGFSCMPDNPATPGPDPMCMDANAMEWTMAWVGHTPPPLEKPGIMYMLTGGTDASNTDPFATEPAEGADWVKTGPHLMLVGSAAALNGHPAGPTPSTGAPYVMWPGTPYAHLMIPVR